MLTPHVGKYLKTPQSDKFCCTVRWPTKTYSISTVNCLYYKPYRTVRIEAILAGQRAVHTGPKFWSREVFEGVQYPVLNLLRRCTFDPES